MIPLILLAAAFGITAILLIVILGRYADRGVKLAYADQTIKELKEKLEAAVEKQENLTSRVENVEAIVISEAWDSLQKDPLPEPAPPLSLPDEPDDLSNEEKAARLARRHRL
ncbi:MAG: hypothetical protein ACE5G0_05790 [Rhodothermales bacterium]